MSLSFAWKAFLAITFTYLAFRFKLIPRPRWTTTPQDRKPPGGIYEEDGFFLRTYQRWDRVRPAVKIQAWAEARWADPSIVTDAPLDPDAELASAAPAAPANDDGLVLRSGTIVSINQPPVTNAPLDGRGTGIKCEARCQNGTPCNRWAAAIASGRTVCRRHRPRAA